METSKPTIPYAIAFKDGSEKTVDAESREELIKKEFDSRKEFEEKVDTLTWKNKSTVCVLHVDSGSVETRIADGDINPYGWRLDHR